MSSCVNRYFVLVFILFACFNAQAEYKIRINTGKSQQHKPVTRQIDPVTAVREDISGDTEPKPDLESQSAPETMYESETEHDLSEISPEPEPVIEPEPEPLVHEEPRDLIRIDELFRKAENSNDSMVRELAIDRLVTRLIKARIDAVDSDYLIYLKTLYLLAGQSDLARVAKEAYDEGFRRTALANLIDPVLIKSVANTSFHTDTALKALEKLDRTGDLLYVMTNSKSFEVRVEALKKLNGDYLIIILLIATLASLMYFAGRGRFYFSMGMATGKIVDKMERLSRGLTDIALYNEEPEKRISAVHNIIDQNVLLNVAKNDAEESVKLAAVDRLTDMDIMSGILMNQGPANVRKRLIEILSGLRDSADTALSILAESEQDPEVRYEAVRTLKDTEMLKLLISDSDTSSKIRQAAVYALPDVSIVEAIAREDSDPLVRTEAVRRLKDRKVLDAVFSADQDYRVRKAAMLSLTGTGSNDDLVSKASQQMLADIACNDSDAETAQSALKLIKSRKLLHIAVKDAQIWETRKEALFCIYEKKSLDSVIEELSNDKEVLALQKILMDIITHENDWSVCRKAASYVSDKREFNAIETGMKKRELYRIWSVLSESLYERRFLTELSKCGITEIYETNSGYECHGKEGTLRFLSSSQYILSSVYTFKSEEAVTIVEQSVDGVGKVVSDSRIFSALRSIPELPSEEELNILE